MTLIKSISGIRGTIGGQPGEGLSPVDVVRFTSAYGTWLKGYSKNNKVKYPVLYFTDAMWHIEILSGSTEYLMENLILVGISWEKDESPEISRYRGYNILKSINVKYQSGDAHNHLAFIQNDVIKYVEENLITELISDIPLEQHLELTYC